ncbi:MAG: exodeoxyribonuclease VII large subunit, partial [Parvibaculum sp.]|nr:exodeoxyribonuclease VII large subunit [Parvibaculum sp.]
GELVADVRDRATRLMRAETRLVDRLRSELTGLARGLPKLADLIALPRQRFDNAADRLGRALIRATEVKGAAFHRIEGRLSDRPIRQRIANERKALPQLLERLGRAEKRGLADLARRLDGSAKLLESYSYHGVLKRGYAVVRDAEGKPVRAAEGQKPGAALEIEFADDRLGVVVAPGGAVKPEPRKTAPKKADGKQGSLL